MHRGTPSLSSDRRQPPHPRPGSPPRVRRDRDPGWSPGPSLRARCLLTPVAMAVALRTGVVDHPGPLKPQGSPVPYLGGVAVFVAVVVGGGLGRP